MSEDAAVTTVAVDTPALEVSPSVLEKLEPREYNAIRDAQEHEAKHPEPDVPEDAATEKENHPRHKSGWQKRIDKLTRRVGESAARAEAAERRASELESKLSTSRTSEQGSAARTEAPRSEPARNRPRDFQETIEAANNVTISPQLAAAIHRTGNKADVVYALQKSPQLLKAIEREPARAAERIAELSRDLAGLHNSFSKETERQDQLLAAHKQRIKPIIAALPDRDKVVAGLNVQISPYVESAILEQENSHDLVIHLARNRALVDELNRMSPAASVAKLGRIAEQLAAKSAAPPRERPKLPDPISTVGGTSARSSVPMDELPMKEFIRVRNSQERARRM
jgi:septal ring factor EnvC (AmiA/AmiB activator)